MKNFSDLEDGQLAYRDSEGNLMILPMDDQDVRDAFVRRLMNEYVEDREVDELLERFVQSAEDARKGNTKSVEEIKE